MQEIIKPCPFCGGEGYLYYNYAYRYRKYLIFVKCEVCSGQAKAYADTECPDDNAWTSRACDNAIKAWNMRFNDGHTKND